MRRKILMLTGAVLLVSTMTITAGEKESDNVTQPTIDQFLEPAKGGLLRGIDFNMTREEVLAIEAKARKIDQSKDHITFSLLPSTTGKPGFAEVTYHFDEQGLVQVVLESFQTDENTIFQQYYNAKSLFDDIYGSRHTTEDGYPYWITTDKTTGLSYQVKMFDAQKQGLSGYVLEYQCQRK